MNRIKANFYMNYKCMKPLLLAGFCAVILFTFILAYLNIENDIKNTPAITYIGVIYTSSLLFLIVLVIVSTKQTFNFSIRMSSSRRDYFIGISVYYMALSLAFSIIHTIFFFLENLLCSYFGISQMNKYSFIFTNFTVLGAVRLTLYTTLIFLAVISAVAMCCYVAYESGVDSWFVILIVGGFAVFRIILLKPFIIDKLPKIDYILNLINLCVIIFTSKISFSVIKKTEIIGGLHS